MLPGSVCNWPDRVKKTPKANQIVFLSTTTTKTETVMLLVLLISYWYTNKSFENNFHLSKLLCIFQKQYLSDMYYFTGVFFLTITGIKMHAILSVFLEVFLKNNSRRVFYCYCHLITLISGTRICFKDFLWSNGVCQFTEV